MTNRRPNLNLGQHQPTYQDFGALSNVHASRNIQHAINKVQSSNRAQATPQPQVEQSNSKHPLEDSNAIVIDLTSPTSKGNTSGTIGRLPQRGSSFNQSSQEQPPLQDEAHRFSKTDLNIIASQQTNHERENVVRREDVIDLTSGVFPRLRNARHKSRLYFPPSSPTTTPSALSSRQKYDDDSSSTPKPISISKTKHSEVSLLKAVTTVVANSSQGRRDARSKSYLIEPPANLQQYPCKEPSGKDVKDSKYADFFPWKGTHVEDTISEVVVRTGYYEKTFIGMQSELASAKATITPILKQKAGLDAASSLFLNVLEKRQQQGKIVGNHTFKPPPRVTLTGPKKEGWLKDLATPTTPLRKLSRTIPHGLRGRDLLDECSAKSIPINRAVWFVRCVGANELRGLKRKGASALAIGNETRWIREWTHQVTQFIEREMGECGKEENATSSKTNLSKPAVQELKSWKERLLYALRLSMHLFTENLLDRPIFVEWYLNLIDTSSLDRLPLALLILQTQLDHILLQRRTARRLAEILLNKVHEIAERSIYLPITRRLCVYLNTILLNHRESLIMPKNWEKNRSCLTVSVNREDPIVEASLQNVITRNNLLLHTSTSQTISSHSSRKSIISTFDTISPDSNIDEVSKSWLALDDHNTLVQNLVEWVVTPLRVGHFRVYVVARVLRNWIRAGVQVQDAIHDFLASFVGSQRSKGHVYLLVSELVRSKHFSASKYMTWLISRGALMRCLSVDEEQPVHTRLLAELPLSSTSAPSSQINLRSNLLAQKGFSMAVERDRISAAKDMISRKISGLFGRSLPEPDLCTKFDDQEINMLRHLSRTMMSEIGFWMYNAVKSCVVEGAPLGESNWRDLTVEVGVSAITLPQFLLVRRVLEEFEDFGLLSETLKSVSNSDTASVLASVADTMNYHSNVFLVLRSAEGITRSLIERYKRLQVRRGVEQKPTEEYLTVSLRTLISVMGMPDVIPQGSPDGQTHLYIDPSIVEMNTESSDPEFESLLSSTDEVDPDVFNRLFDSAVLQLDSSFQGIEDIELKKHLLILTRLRRREGQQFEILMHKWASDTIKSSSRPTLAIAFSNLILAGCIEISTIITLVEDVIATADDDIGSIEAADFAELAFQAVELFLNDDDQRLPMNEQELYSLKLERAKYRAENSQALLALFRKAIQFCVTASDTLLDSRLRKLMTSATMMAFLRSLATSHFDSLVSELIDPFSTKPDPSISRIMNLLIDNLLDEHDTTDVTEADTDVQVTKLLQNANEFSFRLCQLKMKLLFESEISNNKTPLNNQHVRLSITNAFVEAIVDMFKDRGTIWLDLVSVLDEECANQIRTSAEELFLNSPTFPRPDVSRGRLRLSEQDEEQRSEQLTKALLSVMDFAAGANMTSNASSTIAPFADKIGLILQVLSAVEGQVEDPATINEAASEAEVQMTYRELRCWIILYLRIIVIHRSEILSTKWTSTDQGRLVIGLCALLENVNIQSDDFVYDFTLDTLSSLVDDITDDVRQLVRRFAYRKQVSPEFTYLFGSNDSSGGDWLKGIQRNRIVDYPIKPWERLAEPTPFPGENDTALNLAFFHARKVTCRTSVTGSN